MSIKHLPVFLLQISFLLSCGSEAPKDTTGDEMTLPPSMRDASEDSTQIIHLTATQAENLKIKTITVSRNKALLLQPDRTGTIRRSGTGIQLISIQIF